MKLIVTEQLMSLSNGKKVEIEEKFDFFEEEISYTLKNGICFIAKLENKGLSAYIAIVRQTDEKGNFEVVDDGEIALGKAWYFDLDGFDGQTSCKFLLANE